jgi:exopolyphosphatase/guanosine-5'-triphosphate,3'-diphosphate pyrophosphatase
MRIGVLDVGSATAQLVVADACASLPVPVHTLKTRLRLAERVDARGRLDPTAVGEVATAVADAVRRAGEWEVRELYPYATAAVRDAPNRDEALAAVQRSAGLRLGLLSGTEEAVLTFLGARRWLGGQAGPLLLLDIGGGTMEIAYGHGDAPEFAVSLPIGAARLTRELLHRDPPRPAEVKRLRRHVRETLGVATAGTRWDGARTAVATSRTFQQLAQMCGAPPMRKGPFVPRQLNRRALEARISGLAGIPAARRAELPGISAARAGQSLAGAIVAHAAMSALRLDAVTVCPWALREGILLRRLESPTGWDGRVVRLPV